MKENIFMKKDNFTSNFYSFFWHFAKKYKLYLFTYSFLFVFLSYTLNMFLLPYILKYFIDNISTLSLNKGIFIIFLCAFSSANFLIYSIGMRFNFKSMDYISEDIRIFLFERLSKQSIEYFNYRQSGEVCNKINWITSRTGSIFSTTLFLARNILILTIYIIVFCNYNIALGLFILTAFIIYQFIGLKMLKLYVERSNITNSKLNKLTGFINDVFLNISNVKIFASIKREKKNLSDNIDDIIDAEKKEYSQQNFMYFVSFCFSVIFLGSVLLVLGHQLISGKINLGSFVFGIEIVRDMIDQPSTTFSFMQELGSKLKIFNSNLSIIRDEVKITNKKNAEDLVVNSGKIVFKGVKFGYGK